MVVKIITFVGIFIAALGGVITIKIASEGREEQVVKIKFVDSIDYASSKIDRIHRCSFLFSVESNLSDVALIGPFNLKIANATIKRGVPSISLEKGERFELAVNGRDYVPCSEYRMKPWLEGINCLLLSSGNICKVVNVRSNDEL